LDAWHLFHIGLPYEALKGLGALLFFLSVIGFLYKWWSENLRVTTAQGAPSQASVSESNQAALPPVASSSASQQVLVPQDAYYLHDPAPGRGYPHKLWIPFKNESDTDLLVSPARWEKRTAADIATRRIPEHPWTPEGPEGWEKNSWEWAKSSRPGEPIHVPRGRAIQTWVGLPGPLDENELRRRIMTKRLGTLIIPITIDGQAATETIKL